MLHFDPNQYGNSIAQLLTEPTLSELGPGQPNMHAQPALRALSTHDVAAPPGDHDMARCCVSGLWLWHNFLDESHDISQEISSTSGSYWHGIMHRREPDYSNSKYWYRRVGDHAIFPDLLEAAKVLADSLDAEADELVNRSTWDPYLYVDLCEAAARGSSQQQQFARQVATAEWQLLFDHCHRAAQ